MKIYIITDKNGMIIEACQSEIDSKNTIECTKEQFDLIQKQYDTIVKDGKIISQSEGQNAKNLEYIVENNVDTI